MLRRLRAAILVLIIALLVTSTALAQDYLFGVDTETVDVYWNADGTSSIEYSYHFVNQPGAHAIDFVDVGMPVASFDMSSVTADVDGASVSVSKGEYQGSGSGFAVVLGSRAIQPGQSGTVHVFVGSVTGVLREDSDDPNYASAVFAPTFFGSEYVTGSTDMTVNIPSAPRRTARRTALSRAPELARPFGTLGRYR